MLTRRILLATGLAATFASSSGRADERAAIVLQGAALVRKALQNGTAVDQVIPHSTRPYTLLTFDEALVDTLGAFNVAHSSFVVPDGIVFAEFRAQVVWLYNPEGLRQLVIQRKSPLNADPTKFEFFPAGPVSTQQANTSTTTDMETGTVGLVPVRAGEEYAAFPLQVSGSDLAISGGTGTVFGAKFYSIK